MKKKSTNNTPPTLAGYEPTGRDTFHPVRYDLTPGEVAEYGRLLARTIRTVIPELGAEHRTACEPLEEKIKTLNVDREYYLDKLEAVNATDADDAEALANVLAEIESTEDQLRSLKLEYKVALDKANLDVSLWRHRIGLGYEMRSTNCEWLVNWATGMKALVTVATGEVVTRKALSAEERQESMIEELFPPKTNNEEGSGDE